MIFSENRRPLFGDLPEWSGRSQELIHAAVIHPEDRAKVVAEAAAALVRGGPRFDLEYRVVRPDGVVRIVHSQGDVTWDDSGRPVRQVGALQDITELRQAEQEPRASEERFRTLVQFSFDVYWESDAQHRRLRSPHDQRRAATGQLAHPGKSRLPPTGSIRRRER